MNARYLLDTQVLVRWLSEPKKLSREQSRVLQEALRRQERIAVSCISLLEIAVLFGEGSTRSDVPLDELLRELELNPAIEIVPFTIEVAAEVATIGKTLLDPADRAIVCTARVRKLRLLTSDQRIIEANLVTVVE